MNNAPDLDFRFPFTPTTHQNAGVSTAPTPAFAASSSTTTTCFIAEDKTHKNPRKKRSKLIKLDNPVAPNKISRPKYAKKPDPSAPKITKPCSECGKKFWSWKALFGHMRCHPERQWRGIDPPPNLRRPVSPNQALSELQLGMEEEEHEAASSLIMLASGSGNWTCNDIITPTQSVSTSTFQGGVHEVFDGGNNGRFECSSCKKVFGSHQALGGHRASHKNVKGCFAITKSDGEVDQDHHHQSNFDGDEGVMEENMVMVLGTGHKCNICWRVFSSGQALGGHMRCHWDKGEDPQLDPQLGFFNNNNQNQNQNQSQQQPSGISKEGHNNGGGLDLNLPAATAVASHVEDDQSSSYSSSALTLDLRLCL